MHGQNHIKLRAICWWVVNVTPRPLYPQERSGTHCVGGWVVSMAGLDRAENLTLTGIRSLDRPARSESLYRLNYSGPCVNIVNK